jgi:hypothetical protein
MTEAGAEICLNCLQEAAKRFTYLGMQPRRFTLACVARTACKILIRATDSSLAWACDISAFRTPSV